MLEEKIVPHVRDEFGTLQSAIVSSLTAPEVFAQAHGSTHAQAENVMNGVNTHPLVRAHFQFTDEFRKRAIRLLYPHPLNLELTPQTYWEYVGTDIFCRDFLGVVDDQTIFSTVNDFRNDERSRFEPILNDIESASITRTDATFTWGNAVLHGQDLFVGLEHSQYWQIAAQHMPFEEFDARMQHSEQLRHGIRAIAEILDHTDTGRSVLIVPKYSSHDLDCGFAPLPRLQKGDKRRAIVQEEVFHPAAFDLLRKRFDELIFTEDPISVLGCNIQWLDPETPLIPREAVQTVRTLRGLGYNPVEIPLQPIFDQFTVEGFESGGCRCMTGVLERANDYDND